MLKKTEGIVLKSSIFGEADLIVTYLTLDYGLLKVFAKSPRKIKSRFGSSLEPLTYSKISFIGKENANLPRLIQSDIIMSFHALRDDFKSLLSVSEIIRLNLNFVPDREPNFDIFKLFLNILLKLEFDSASKLYYLYYKMRFLEITGYSPGLDACGKCGLMIIHAEMETQRHRNTKHYESLPHHRVTASLMHHNFYIAEGSIICEKCISDSSGSIRLSGGALRFYRSLLKWHISNINRINAPEYLISEITNVIDSHIQHIKGGVIDKRKAWTFS